MDLTLVRVVGERLASRIWARETAPFAPKTASPIVHDAIANRLGWLDCPDHMSAKVAEVNEFAAETRAAGLTDVYLLGMGGSSLSSEVFRDVPTAREHGARLTVLDTTDERTIREATEQLVPERALFLVSSKSGTTIEVSSLEHHFRRVLTDAGREAIGSHFVAITDPGTPLVRQAASEGYRRTFENPPDIGGRYSALSLFGLVPAALVGIDIASVLESARDMADRCRADEALNPGLALGAFIGEHALAGRDKLTLLTPPSFDPFGVWVEQLIAESTGKIGRGVLPVVGEPIGRSAEYGTDRAFVAILTPDGSDVRAAASRIEASGQPMFRIETGVADLGAEFFRWEFATAVAGAVIGVNPFDEPNVKDAKERTQAQLDARKATGAFHTDPPFDRGPGYSRREHPRKDDQGVSDGGRYVAVLDYLPADATRQAAIRRLREALRHRTRVVTTHGVGPRYLHSTGQYHKGGPNTGMFLLFTAADTSATPIPGTDYSFSTLKQAQALGDFDALAAAGREVIHYHVDDPMADFSAELEKVVLGLK